MLKELQPSLIVTSGSKRASHLLAVPVTDCAVVTLPNPSTRNTRKLTKKNAILFLHKDSQDPRLHETYQVCNSHKEEISINFDRVPRKFINLDDLAGGAYVFLGCGTISPGPTACP